MRKIPLSLIILLFLVVFLGLVGLGIIMGFIPINPFGQFMAFVFALVIISVFAMIGAVFLGMFISHRVFSSREFTAFEEEMLSMREDIKYIRKRMEELEEED